MKNWSILWRKYFSTSVKYLSTTEKRIGGAARLLAVALSIIGTVVSLYSRFTNVKPVIETTDSVLFSDRKKALLIIKNNGGVFKTSPKLFPPVTMLKPGSEGYLMGWYRRRRKDCVLVSSTVELISDLGYSIKIGSVSVLSTNAPLGEQMMPIPFKIPNDTQPGNYTVQAAMFYRCGELDQIIEFPKATVVIL